MTDVREQLRTCFGEIDPPFDPAGLMSQSHTGMRPQRSVVDRGVLIAWVASVVPTSFPGTAAPVPREPAPDRERTGGYDIASSDHRAIADDDNAGSRD